LEQYVTGMKDLVIIDNTTLAAMVGNQQYRDLIPCLQDTANAVARPRGRRCGSCSSRSAKESQTKLLDRARNCLRELPTDKRNAVKKLLNTRKYRLIYRNNAGIMVKMTY